MSLEILVVQFILSLMVAYWAKTWGSNPTTYMLVSFLLSPAIGILVLLFKGNKNKNLI